MRWVMSWIRFTYTTGVGVIITDIDIYSATRECFFSNVRC
jgi:hypothetical protein